MSMSYDDCKADMYAYDYNAGYDDGFEAGYDEGLISGKEEGYKVIAQFIIRMLSGKK